MDSTTFGLHPHKGKDRVSARPRLRNDFTSRANGHFVCERIQTQQVAALSGLRLVSARIHLKTKVRVLPQLVT
jgi:hypothetical protein